MIFKFLKFLKFLKMIIMTYHQNKSPIKICITGGAGQIAYSLLLEVASGKVFGADQVLINYISKLPRLVTLNLILHDNC